MERLVDAVETSAGNTAVAKAPLLVDE